VQGPVLPIAFYLVEPVGSFMSSTRISFSVARSSEVSAITLEFVAQMDLNVTDSIFLSLGGFGLEVGKNQSLNGSFPFNVLAEVSRIRFRPIIFIHARAAVSVTLPA
jgi:hypothetical protein